MRLWFTRIIGMIFVWLALHTAWVCQVGLENAPGSAPVGVVLGNTVYSNGQLSPRLTARVQQGLVLYRQGRVQKLIVSGGTGVEGVPEGTAMKRWLVKSGMPDSLIIVDNHGDNTRASAINTRRICDSLSVNAVVIVSQYFHLARARLLFRQAGIGEIGLSSPDYVELRDVYALFREWAAFYAALL